eukprot:3223894-Alexandrium_andersonii.AAC.1
MLRPLAPPGRGPSPLRSLLTLARRPVAVAPAPSFLRSGRVGPRRPMTTTGPSASPKEVSEPVPPVVESVNGSGTSVAGPGPGG